MAQTIKVVLTIGALDHKALVMVIFGSFSDYRNFDSHQIRHRSKDFEQFKVIVNV